MFDVDGKKIYIFEGGFLSAVRVRRRAGKAGGGVKRTKRGRIGVLLVSGFAAKRGGEIALVFISSFFFWPFEDITFFFYINFYLLAFLLSFWVRWGVVV